MIKTAVIIGSGNLATQLALALHKSGILIKQIYSRKSTNANTLAQKLNADATNDFTQLYREADIYFLSLSDDAQEEYANAFPFKDKLIVHTSGSLDIDILKESSKNFGVFYPLQTFNKQVSLDFSKVPICIEASNTGSIEKLKFLCKQLSCKWYNYNSEKRKFVHLAAVFCCNFANHMISISEDILHKQDIPLEIIEPLVNEPFSKAINNTASSSQTGPALRNDIKILEKHNKLLKYHFKEYSELYKTISSSIFEFHNKKDTNDSD